MDKSRTKDEAVSLTKLPTAEKLNLKVMSLRKSKKSSKVLTQDLRDASGPSVDPSTVHWSLIRKWSPWRVAVKKSFFRKGNREKR